MPEICRFLGIVVRMYYDDHPPAHFHARYGGHEAKIEIATGAVIAGNLPRRAMALVWEWWELHQQELDTCWERVAAQQEPGGIEPLE